MAELPKNLDTVRRLMTAPTSAAKVTQAMDMCRELALQQPDNFEIHHMMGVLAFQLEGPQAAVPHLEKSVALEPRSVETRTLIVRCLSDMGEWEAAVPHAQHALALQTKNGNLHLHGGNLESLSILARHALYSDDWDRASSYFTHIVDFVQNNITDENTSIQTFDTSALPPIGKRKTYPILYLPVEIKARELESKSLLALAAAEAGFHVVIGRTWVLSAESYHDTPPGIMMFKTLNAMDAMNMATAQLNGPHLIAALDEEAFGRSASPRAVKLNVAPIAVDVADLVLMQGRAHQETWANLFGIDARNLKVTGNPKTDLLSKRITYNSRKVAAKPVILFCAMSGNINSKGRGFARTMSATMASAVGSYSEGMMSELGSLLRASAQFETAMIPQITETIHAIADKFPEADIVLRPHPVEDPALWLNRFNHLTHVRVEPNGTISEWLDQCDVMIYLSGCATGVEAMLHGTPALHFAGNGAAEDPGFGVSSSLNPALRSATEIVEALEHVLEVEYSGVQSDKLNTYLWSGDGELVCRHVATALHEFWTQHQLKGPLPIDELRNLGENRRKKFDLKPFHLQKYPNTSIDEMKSILEGLAARFKLSAPNSIEEIEDGLFLITPPAMGD